MSTLKQYMPFLSWMVPYKKEFLAGDLSAGLTVGVMLIPQGMAYSMLAGLPPIYGLYASTIPLIIYALFGTSRQLAVGPSAMVALLTSTGVGALAVLGSSEFVAMAILLAMLVGIIQLAMGVFRLGFVVNFLSHPVIAGFTSAAAVIIGLSQLKYLLGIQIPRGSVTNTVLHAIQNFDQVNLPTLTIGLLAIGILVIFKKINKKIPAALIVVVLSMVVVYFFELHVHGVRIVRDVPVGLPAFGVPSFSWSTINHLIPTALAISFIGFIESIAVAKAIHAKHKNYDIVPNQELIGLGLANIFGSLFKAFPVTGGFARSAVNDQAGARTGMASIISALLIVITLLFLTSYFYYLPNAVLAAIIMVAVVGLIDIKEAKHLLHTDRRDFLLFLVTGIGTLFLGIEEGIVIGVVLSMAMVIYRVSYPHIAELGRIPNSVQYRNINRFENLDTARDILILRFDAQLYFANANYFKDFISDKLDQNEHVKHIILHAGSINSIDSSALHMLHDVMSDIEARDIKMYFVEVTGPIRDILNKTGFTSLLGAERFFLNVNDAVEYIRRGTEDKAKAYTLQSNTF
jgi:SulP family sulfate permease